MTTDAIPMTLPTKAAEIAEVLTEEDRSWLHRRQCLHGMRLRGSFNAAERAALQKMRRLGMFTFEQPLVAGRKRLWVLTPLGQAVAEHLGKSDGG